MSALLEVRDLRKYFPVRGGLLRRVVAQVKAVDGVSFTLEPGKTLGLVGESGCGKSTLGRAILRLQQPTGGQVLLEGRDLATLSPGEMVEMRREMQIIFQDPFASLSPRRTVAQTIREPHRQEPQPCSRRSWFQWIWHTWMHWKNHSTSPQTWRGTTAPICRRKTSAGLTGARRRSRWTMRFPLR